MHLGYSTFGVVWRLPQTCNNDDDDDDDDNNNNNKLQLGYHPVAVVILHVHKYEK